MESGTCRWGIVPLHTAICIRCGGIILQVFFSREYGRIIFRELCGIIALGMCARPYIYKGERSF